jgi:uncharacterized protein YjiS (DUF1127 family)
MSEDGFDLRPPRAHPITLPWITRRKHIVRRANRERRRSIGLMVSGAFAVFAQAFRRWNDRQRSRAALRAMSDYELRDLGVSRTAIDAAIRRYEGNPEDYPDS